MVISIFQVVYQGVVQFSDTLVQVVLLVKGADDVMKQLAVDSQNFPEDTDFQPRMRCQLTGWQSVGLQDLLVSSHGFAQCSPTCFHVDVK